MLSHFIRRSFSTVPASIEKCVHSLSTPRLPFLSGTVFGDKDLELGYRSMMQTHNPIKLRMAEPLTPPPIRSLSIPRPAASTLLTDLVARKSYCLLSGASGTGKTAALCSLLSGRLEYNKQTYAPAPIRISLRSIYDRQQADECVRDALGIADPKCSLRSTIMFLRQTLDEIRSENTRFLPVLWLDDIDQTNKDFLAEFSALAVDYLYGACAIFYCVADDSLNDTLRTASGHSIRLKILRFPEATNDEIIEGLSHPPSRIVRKWSIDVYRNIDKDIFVEYQPRPILTVKQAREVVDMFGSNLGQIDEMLSGLTYNSTDGLAKNFDVIFRGSCESVLSSERGLLRSCFSHQLFDAPDGPARVLAAVTIFDALIKAHGKPVDAVETLGPQFQSDPFVFEFVRPLIEQQNLLQYENMVEKSETVLFKRRTLLHAWQAMRNDPVESSHIIEAMAAPTTQALSG
eukprot:TRINITY_DN233_c0_g2_i1.p1 TRINITY_DN233_c0_g2~~TRINITY_DN233_c0_g2_i1.p1  ORF type:complete len:459 (+),score=58.70 TRINITY_DN233_c0_g2_i1:394-1770(+)